MLSIKTTSKFLYVPLERMIKICPRRCKCKFHPKQTVGIPMGTNCAPLLADFFLYSYEAHFIQGLLKKNEKKLARSFNFTFRCTDDVLSLNNIGASGRLLHINGKFTMGKIEIIFFVVKFRS
jgi:hypothetical protein